MADALMALAGLVVVGVAAQWLAWRLHLPSILLLLPAGLVAGLTGFIDPDALTGDAFRPIVSLAVAVILFEGGLNLRFRDLRDQAHVVWKLVTVGVMVTMAVASVGAHVLLGLSRPVSALLGAILVVSGPTVIGPMLLQVRPKARLASILRWEGIVVDPIGALLAVLTFELILHGVGEQSLGTVLLSLFETVGAGVLVGLLGGGIVLLLESRYWVPDYLSAPVVLGLVLTVFVGSEALQEESGLVAVTTMGALLRG